MPWRACTSAQSRRTPRENYCQISVSSQYQRFIISVYIKHGHSKGVKPLKTKHTDIAWTKLDHSYFKLKKDIYQAPIYISPEHTSGNLRYLTLNLYIPSFCKILKYILKVEILFYRVTLMLTQAQNQTLSSLMIVPLLMMQTVIMFPM